MIRLLKTPGKPLHPPLTDASIGSYTLGVAALIAGKAGLQTPQMAHSALIAISFALLLALPTAITGPLDWLDLERGTPARTVATIHLFVMLGTTVLFAVTALLLYRAWSQRVRRARGRRQHRRRECLRLRHTRTRPPRRPAGEGAQPAGRRSRGPTAID